MPQLANFESQLAALIGMPTPLRPFICDGSPLTCEALIVGFNPATTISTDFWDFWQPGIGFNKTAWREAYTHDRQTRPLAPGKKRRNPVSNTRRVLDRILESAAPVRCLETNIYWTPTAQATDLAEQERVSTYFDFLLNQIQPKVIVTHGVDAQSHFQRITTTAQIISVAHFSRGWSHAAAHALGEQIKQACDHVRVANSQS